VTAELKRLQERRQQRDGAAASRPLTQWVQLPQAAALHRGVRRLGDVDTASSSTPVAQPPADRHRLSVQPRGYTRPSAEWAMSPRELTYQLSRAASIKGLARLLQPLLLSEGAPGGATVPVAASGAAGRVNLQGRAAHAAVRRAGGLHMRPLTAAFNQLTWLMNMKRAEPARQHTRDDGAGLKCADVQLASRIHAALCGQLVVMGPQLDLRGCTTILWALGKMCRCAGVIGQRLVGYTIEHGLKPDHKVAGLTARVCTTLLACITPCIQASRPVSDVRSS
jgi:hypothetical protein